MLSLLIQKELKSIIASPKFAATFGTCAVLILLSVFIGIQEYRASMTQYETARQLNDQEMAESSSWSALHTRVYRQRLAHNSTRPVNKIEHPGRKIRFINHLGKQVCAQRRQFTGLQYNGATGGQRRNHFTGHLIDGPIPGCNQGADANRFFQ